jgi:hypothetical protein
VLGFLLSFSVGYVPSAGFIAIPSGFSLDLLPAGVLADMGIYFGSSMFLLIGAIVVFFRSAVGAVLLLIGAVAAFLAIVAEPALVRGSYSWFFDYVTSFRDLAALARAVDAVGSPVVFMLAVVPPTFSYLRHRTPNTETYGRPRAYPPQDR